MSNAAKFKKKAAEFELQKQFDKAVASYMRAIEVGDAEGAEVDVSVLNKVGDLTLRLGRVTEAVASYERAVEHYSAVGLFNNAIALCNKILRHAPGRAGVYLTLGRICARKGMRGDATRNFLEYASRMKQEGRTDEAMRSLAEVAGLMPELEEVRRMVEEHAERVGIALPAAASEAAAAAPDAKSQDGLVFLDVDYDSPVALTPPLGTVPVSLAAPAGRAPAAPPPVASTSSLDDLLIFDPSEDDAPLDVPAPLDGLEGVHGLADAAQGVSSLDGLTGALPDAEAVPAAHEADLDAAGAAPAEGLTDAMGYDVGAQADPVPAADALDGLIADEDDAPLLMDPPPSAKAVEPEAVEPEAVEAEAVEAEAVEAEAIEAEAVEAEAVEAEAMEPVAVVGQAPEAVLPEAPSEPPTTPSPVSDEPFADVALVDTDDAEAGVAADDADDARSAADAPDVGESEQLAVVLEAADAESSPEVPAPADVVAFDAASAVDASFALASEGTAPIELPAPDLESDAVERDIAADSDAEVVDAESVVAEPVEWEPEVATPVEPEPVLAEPIESEPIESEPVESEPVESEPVLRSEPVESEPVEAEPVESEPVLATEPVDAESVVEASAEVEPDTAELISVTEAEGGEHASHAAATDAIDADSRDPESTRADAFDSEWTAAVADHAGIEDGEGEASTFDAASQDVVWIDVEPDQLTSFEMSYGEGDHAASSDAHRADDEPERLSAAPSDAALEPEPARDETPEVLPFLTWSPEDALAPASDEPDGAAFPDAPESAWDEPAETSSLDTSAGGEATDRESEQEPSLPMLAFDDAMLIADVEPDTAPTEPGLALESDLELEVDTSLLDADPLARVLGLEPDEPSGPEPDLEAAMLEVEDLEIDDSALEALDASDDDVLAGIVPPEGLRFDDPPAPRTPPRARPPIPRLNPHDFILPGELPPLLVPLSMLGLEAVASVAAAVDETRLASDESAVTTETVEEDAEDLEQDLDGAFAQAFSGSYQAIADELAALDAPITPTATEAARHLALERCARLREDVEAHPGDWARRRRLAEALFEAGERDAGLEELGATALGLEVEGALGDSVRVLDELVRVAPDTVQYHQKRVELAVRLGDRDRLRDAYLDLADALVRTGQASRAEPVYVRVLELDPWDDRARAALGDAAPPPPAPRPPAPSANDGYVNLADWLADDPTPRDTRMRVQEPVVTGDEDADFDQLLQHFREGVARSLGDDDYESHYDLGVAYKEMGLLDDAVAEFQRALRSPTHRLPAYEALGQCFLEQGSFPVAVTVLSRALHEPGLDDEQRIGVLYLLGYACEALQRVDEARSYYQRVYATDINFRDVAERLDALDRGAR